ncbi:MAG: hypothetical protein ACYCZO_06930 [Daejeonella sp.]
MENNNSKLALAIVAGVAAGATAWYLMGTENGKHNWTALLDVVKDISDKLLEASSDGGSMLASAGKEASEFIAHKSNGVHEEAKSFS